MSEHKTTADPVQQPGQQDFIRTNVDIPRTVHKKLKTRAIEENSTMKALIMKAIITYLETDLEDNENE